MRSLRTGILAALATALLVWPGMARAGFTLSALDTPTSISGITPENLPNSHAAFQNFSESTATLGTLTTANFGTATGSASQYSLAGGVSVSLSGAQTIPSSPVESGVVTSNPNSVDGFNLTSTDNAFLRLTPNVTTIAPTGTIASFTFAKPVEAVGVYLIGVGTATGTFAATVHDTGDLGTYTMQLSSIAAGSASDSGGVQYFSFIDPGSTFTRIDFQINGYSTTSRDIVGFDGLSFVTPNVTPEPSTTVLMTLGALGLLAAHRRGKVETGDL